MYNFLNYLVNNFIVGDDDWFFGSNLNVSGHFHTLLNYFFDLVNLGHLVNHLDNLLLDGSYFLYLLLQLNGKHWLFSNHLHLLNLLRYVWHYLLYFLYLLVHNRPFFHLCDFLYSRYFLNNFNQFLDFDWHFLNLLHLLLNQDKFFNNFIARDGYFEGNDNRLFHLYDFLYLVSLSHYFVFAHFLRDLYSSLDKLLLDDFNILYYLFLLDCWHNLLPNHLYLLVDWHFNVPYDLNLHNLLYVDGNVHLPHNFLNLLYLNDSVHNLLNDLRDFHYLLNNPWHYHYLLYDFLDLHHFWDFH